MIALSHTNIRLRDIDRCLPFYTEVLGLRVTLDEDSGWRRAVFLRWGEGPRQSFVVLQSLPEPEGESVSEPKGFQARLAAMGVNHFGFWVEDIEAILVRAARAGAQSVRDAVVTCKARDCGYDDSSDAPAFRTRPDRGPALTRY